MRIRSVLSRLARSRWPGIVVAGLLCGLYAQGGAGWVLGFVALVPWLHTLGRERSLAGALLSGWGLSVVFTAAVFGWFGLAVGAYTQAGAATGLGLLLLAAPLFQPQFLVFAGVRYLVRRNAAPMDGPGAAGPAPLIAALAGAAAWVAAEWALPRLLGDTLGHGLYPSRWLRQAADLGGATGLTALLLLANEASAVAWARRTAGFRAMVVPMAAALALPLALAAYGAARLAALDAAQSPPAATLRMGLVQSNLHDYERLRQEKGAAAVVREVLDTHYAMSWDAVERQRAQAVLWSETVYPTTFGQPKSPAGAELDREIQEIVNAAGVPFVFGTYQRGTGAEAPGEYNAAVFVQPGSGLLGTYRKTRLFPLTEFVPGWLEGPALRRWLPWAGAWQPGDGARVFPLRLAGGREVPVQPLICLDDVDAGLAIAGARLGAQALLTLSNDAWFTQHEQGARLHAAVAAFRSIETRLPQFRVTTTGLSAAFDRTGTPVATTRLGERALLVADLPVGEPPATLMVAWGDWVGPSAAAALGVLALVVRVRRWRPGSRRAGDALHAEEPESDGSGAGAALMGGRHATSSGPVAVGPPLRVALLPPAARWAAGLLRLAACAGTLWLILQLAWGDGHLLAQPVLLLRSFAALALLPAAAAWCVMRAFQAHVSLAGSELVFARGRQRRVLPLGELAGVEPWRLPLPGPGASLRLASGGRWPLGVALADPLGWAAALQRATAAAGLPPLKAPPYRLAAAHARAAQQGACRAWPTRPVARFGLLPLVLALPAFRLHQQIAYGGPWGEYLTFGPMAFLATAALWWATWAVGVALCAAVLRGLVEAAALAVLLLRPASAGEARWWLERGALVVLYAGLPLWLALRLVGV